MNKDVWWSEDYLEMTGLFSEWATNGMAAKVANWRDENKVKFKCLIKPKYLGCCHFIFETIEDAMAFKLRWL